MTFADVREWSNYDVITLYLSLQYGFTVDSGHDHYAIKEDKRKDGIKSTLVSTENFVLALSFDGVNYGLS